MLNHIDEASDAIANIRDDWDRIVQDYNAYGAVLIEAGIPMVVDDQERDLIDGLLALAQRCKEAEQAARDIMQAIPERCPITGAEFSRIEEHPERGMVAMYGSGPSPIRFSIPELASDASTKTPLHKCSLSGLVYNSETKEWTIREETVRLIHVCDLEALQLNGAERDRARNQLAQAEAAIAAERTDLAEQLAESRRREQLAVDQARKAEIECRRLEDLAKAMQRDRDQIRKSFNSTNDDFGELIVAAGDLVKECESCRAPWSRPRWSIVARVAPLVFSRRNGDGAS